MEEGQILAGKYRVEHVLGVGGMGVVVAAHHAQLDTRVAVKLLLPGMLANQEALARFTREARAAIQMTSSHAARVFDVGLLETGAPYIVMELLEGADLGTLLQQHGPLGVADAVDFVLQACEAVAEAHALGIVHRDLKPSNLFLCKRGDGRQEIKVLDFGISKVAPVASSPEETLTQVTSLVGSPLYMSPEQIEAPHTVDARTDIWALGIILYELLSARTPFFGNTLPQVSIKIAVRAPTPLREFRPEVPANLAAVIAVCLEKDRAKRFGNVAELAVALLPFGPRQSRASVDRIADAVHAAGLSSTAPSPGSTQPTTLPASEDLEALLRPSIRSPPGGGPRAPSWFVVSGVLALAGVLAFGFALPKPRAAWERAVWERAIGNAGGAGGAAGARVAPAAASESVAPAPAVQPSMTVTAGVTAAVPQPWSIASQPSPAGERPAAAPAPRASPNRVPVTVATAATRAGCEHDFDLDDQGRKHFKPECMAAQRTAAGAAVPSKSDCDPNFDLDDQGRKHFKPQCFLNQGR